MADISPYIRQIEVAARGEEVRDSIVGALSGMNDSIAPAVLEALEEAKENGDFKGEKGDPGEEGPQGLPGADGVSAAVSITEITGGHRVTITDKDHPQGQSIDLMDGGGYTFDTAPTEGSTNPVTSGGIYLALAAKADASSVTSTGELDAGSVYTKAEVDAALEEKADVSTTYTKAEVDAALEGKQDGLTFDDAPASGSRNPVASAGIWEALEGKADASAVYTKAEVDAALEEQHVVLSFDSTPTSGSSNPVTSDGIYTAIENAASVPDWNEGDETAPGYIKNRPFYRTLESSEKIFSIGASGKINSYSGEWDYSPNYKYSEVFVPGQKYRVLMTYNSVSMSEIVTAVKYDTYNIRLTGSEFYLEETLKEYFSTEENLVHVGIHRTAFGGQSKYFTCSVYQETYSYTTLPEEYLDTSFAAPEFSDAARVSGDAADYAKAYMLLYADGAYHRDTFAAAFSSRLAATGLAAKVGSAETSLQGLASRVDGLEETVAAMDTGTASETDNSQNELIASLQSQVASLQSQAASLQAQAQSLLSRVAYLESLHTEGDVALSETDGTLNFDGAGAEVTEGELVLNSGNVSVVDGELVYGTGDQETIDVDEDGALSFDGAGAGVTEGELVLDSENVSVVDGELVYGTGDQETAGVDGEGTLTLGGSGVTVDSEGNCDIGTNGTVEDGTITI